MPRLAIIHHSAARPRQGNQSLYAYMIAIFKNLSRVYIQKNKKSILFYQKRRIIPNAGCRQIGQQGQVLSPHIHHDLIFPCRA